MKTIKNLNHGDVDRHSRLYLWSVRNCTNNNGNNSSAVVAKIKIESSRKKRKKSEERATARVWDKLWDFGIIWWAIFIVVQVKAIELEREVERIHLPDGPLVAMESESSPPSGSPSSRIARWHWWCFGWRIPGHREWCGANSSCKWNKRNFCY